MTEQLSDEAHARFEALLAQVLITDEKAQEHQALKHSRGSARLRAILAKDSFERNRERLRKERKRQPKRHG